MTVKRPKPAAESRQQIWTALRGLKGAVDTRELSLTASTDTVVVSPAAAGAFLRRLARAGYVFRLAAGRSCHWRLNPAANSGPRAPEPRGDRLFDANRQMPVTTLATTPVVACLQDPEETAP
ncbi:hypothetical protein [Phreatobacter stygius]|uniref:Uncharacterized protein n=1 Tax=Phreatobacter stygius TaxID=1940610 RepID=A0A4D7AUY9_9HYPH|nr:hypothetical protein [Phreatobacter stygius]QCI65544.1 hypothetical protein E8M01_15810 [Phreatobacter stygius]